MSETDSTAGGSCSALRFSDSSTGKLLPPSTPPLFISSTLSFPMKFSSFLLFFLTFLMLTGCANPGSGPDGGPFDETPPRIIGMSPALGATGEKSKKVSIYFDEIIKVENPQEKITISPPQIEMPEIKTFNRKIMVNLADSLKPNTTYTIDFSDAIVDNNEGNPLGNFTYFFSTGSQVDTMEVGGYVLSADDLEPIKGILVGLHSNLADSAFTTLPFDRVARTDDSGHFSIKGVAPGTYRIYALKDMDNDFRYTRGEMMAFLREQVVPSSFRDVRQDTLWADTVHVDTILQVPYTHFLPDDLTLLAFTELNRTRQLLKTEREPNYFRMFFTAPSAHVPTVEPLDFEKEGAWMEERSKGNDTITYWLCDTTLFNRDSLTIKYTYEATNDSTGINYLRTDTLTLIPRLTYERRKKLEAEAMEKWQKALEKRHRRGDYSQEVPPKSFLEIKYHFRSSLAPDGNPTFTLPEPAAKLDTNALHLFLKVDSANYRLAPYRLERDSFSLCNYRLRGEWRPGQEYLLNVDSAFVTGLSGKVNRTYDTKFSITPLESFGALFLLIPDADATAVAQLLNGSGRVRKQLPVVNGRVDFFYLDPGDYYVRLFNDRNGNGQWDEGCYAEGRQAEEVYYFPQAFSIRANWDVEQTWRLNELPLIEQKPRELIKQKAKEKETPRSRNAERERQKR